MDTAQVLWAVGGIFALVLLPVGAFRMLAYKSGEVDHTPALRSVALLALGLGALGFVVFGVLTLWFLVTGNRPF
jgi:glucose uptake protein GlcU